MWLIIIGVLILTSLLLLAKAWLARGGNGGGSNLGHMSDQWLAENRNSHQP